MDPFARAVALQAGTPGVGPDVLSEYWPSIVRAGWFVLGFVVVLVVGWYVLEPAVDRVVTRRNRDNPTIQEAIARYVRLLVLVVAFVVGIGVAGYGRVLTDSAIVVAAATLAIGVAGQTVIGSLVSGVALVADPEFNVGDYIEWGDGESGTVQSITLRFTRVRTPNDALVTIPNTVLTDEIIVRPYGRGRVRVVEHVGLAYEDDVDAALEHLAGAAADMEAIQDVPTPRAYVEEFGSDAVVARVHYWIGNPTERDVLGVKSAYARTVKDRLDDAGITIAPASKRELEGRIEVGEGA